MKKIDLALLRNCTEANLHITYKGKVFWARIYTRGNGTRAIETPFSDHRHIADIKQLLDI
jgi:hypothetical protein